MDEELEPIKKYVDNRFAYFIATLSLKQLYEFKTSIMNEELLIPCLRKNISFQLEMLRQRVEALTDLIEAEAKRKEREQERIKGGKGAL